MTSPTSRATPTSGTENRPVREFIKTIIFAVLLALTFRSFFYEPFHIPSGSMKSNLLVGDYLFVSKPAYGYSRYSFPLGLPLFGGRAIFHDLPQRGDVVVFRPVTHPHVDYIKRVIGLPGDRIQMKDGVLHINGHAVKKEYVDDFTDDEDPSNVMVIARYRETLPEGKTYFVLDMTKFGDADNTPEYTVPEGKYFMMGDNRDNSTDSRFQNQIGFVPLENIVGRAKIIGFSTDGSARFWEIWKWLPSLRLERFFRSIE